MVATQLILRRALAGRVLFSQAAQTPLTACGLDVNPVPVGESIWMHAHVGCNPCSGILQWAMDGVVFQGGNIDSNGNAQNPVGPLPPVGSHLLSAIYPGDANNAPATYTFSFSVIPDTLPVPQLSVNIPSAPVVQGTSPPITTSLACTDGCGWTTWYIDGQVFQGGQITQGGTMTTWPHPAFKYPCRLARSVRIQYGGNAADSLTKAQRSSFYVGSAGSPTVPHDDIGVAASCNNLCG